jgi:hypothetical protein
MTLTVGASESEKLRCLWADGKSTGIFLTVEEAAILLIDGLIVRRSAVEEMFVVFPNRLKMLRKLSL